MEPTTLVTRTEIHPRNGFRGPATDGSRRSEIAGAESGFLGDFRQRRRTDLFVVSKAVSWKQRVKLRHPGRFTGARRPAVNGRPKPNTVHLRFFLP
jgi:hypothetical protein